MALRKDTHSFIRAVLVILLTISAFLIYFFTSKDERSPAILTKDPIKMAGGFYSSDLFRILLPIAICLLCSDICQEELSNNFFYVKLIRENRLSYIAGHVLSIVKYSCLCLLILVLIPQLIGIVLTGSLKVYGDTDLKEISALELYINQCLIAFLLILIYGFSGSMISVMFSAKAAGFLMPFAISYLLRWLRINYLKSIYPIDSSYWFSSEFFSNTKTVSEGIWLLIFMALTTVVIFSVIIYRHITERE